MKKHLKKPGCLGTIGDEKLTQFHRDSNKTILSRPIHQPGFQWKP